MTRLTCRQVIEQFLAAYVEDELEPQVRAVFDEHLGVCPSCVDYLSTYRQTIALTQAARETEPLDEDEVPEPVVGAILEALRQQAEGE